MKRTKELMVKGLHILMIVALGIGWLGEGRFGPVPQARAAFVINVDIPFDVIAPDGFCSLREAIITANTNEPIFPGSPGECMHDGSPGMDTIILQAPGPYLLTIVGPGEQAAASGDLDILEDLTLQGNGQVIDGSALQDRIFEIIGATVFIHDATVQNGWIVDDFGGGVRNSGGTLTLVNSQVLTNTAETINGGLGGIRGGGIYSTGVLTLTNSHIQDNKLIDVISGTIRGDVYAGGGLYNDGGWVTIDDDSRFFRNLVPDFFTPWAGQATVFRGGGIYNAAGGNLTISGSSVITFNYVLDVGNLVSGGCDFSGGGIYNEAGARLTINASTVGQNGAVDASAGSSCDFLGGGIYNAGVTMVADGRVASNGANGGSGYAGGGGLYNATGAVLTLTTGSVVDNQSRDGGGLHNDSGGMVSLTESRVSSNEAGNYGGGLYNAGTISLTYTTVATNTAAQNGGGLYNAGLVQLTRTTVATNVAQGSGGGIRNEAFLAVDHSLIFNNESQGDGGGGGVSNHGGTIDVAQSDIVANRTNADGGGLWNSGVLTLTEVVLSNNVADAESDDNGHGGGLYSEGGAGWVMLIDSEIISNTAFNGGGIHNLNSTVTLNPGEISQNMAYGWGGGLYNDSGAVTLVNTTVVTNTAAKNGGGLENENQGRLTLTNTVIANNEAQGLQGGGGIFNFGTVTGSNSTIARNRASDTDGGGIWNGTALALTNVTLSNNTAQARGGGLFNNFGATLTLTHVTASFNEAVLGTGGGLYLKENITATLQNTIVSSNTNQDCAGLGSPTSLGYNLDSDGACHLTATGDITHTDPQLGPLQNNGGHTDTHALLGGSPAFEAVPLGHCPLSADQRGVSRPQGMACDIGAYEAVPLSLLLSKSAWPEPGLVDHPLTYTVTIVNVGTTTATDLIVTDTLPENIIVSAVNPAPPTCLEAGGTVTCNLSSLDQASTAAVTIMVSPMNTGLLVNTASVRAKEAEINLLDNTDTITTIISEAESHLYLPIIWKNRAIAY